jgi:ABC-type polysaccharide/polyol phosphate export permease
MWTYFAEGTRVGLAAFLRHAKLLKNMALPRTALLLASVLNVTITFGINLLILAAFYAAQGVFPSVQAATFALGLALVLGIFTLGISLGLVPLNVRLRDLGQIWEVVLTLGFYSAPIIYSLELIPPAWRWVLWFNPVGYVIHFQREALLFDRYASGQELLLLAGIAAGALAAGWAVYRYFKATVADYL